MTSKLKCPFCKEEIISDLCLMCAKIDKGYTSGRQIYKCNKCGLFGNKELVQELIRTHKALEIARKALKEIDTTRCIPQQTLISLGKFSKTTRFNAGNIICVATPDYIHNTLEQIKHKEQK